MAKLKQLELDEDLPFQKREWGIQRVGWVMWALVVAAALIGLFGTGPLSSAQTTTADNALTVHYDRFLQCKNPTTLELLVRTAGGNSGPVRINVSQPLLDALRIVRIEPEPERRELAEDGIIYSFARTGETAINKIRFHVEYERFGRQRGSIALEGHEPVTLAQLVYP
jgi:hypothetical protein